MPTVDPTTWLILLRGVTPSGKNRVPMAPLREALAGAGLGEVRTYIQSGNVVATSRLGQAEVEQLVHAVIRDTFGGDITVVARTRERFRPILEQNPFAAADPSQLYFSLLKSQPSSERRIAFEAIDWHPDDVRIVDDVVYTRYATRASESKYGNNFFERKLKVAATTRNLNTMSRLVELAAG